MKVLWVHNFDPNRLNAGCFIKAVIPKMRSLGVEIDLHYLGNLRSISNIIRAIKKLKKVSAEYDIIHAQYGSMCGFITSFVKTPKILTIRGNDWSVHNESFSFPYIHTRISRFLTRISIKSFNEVIPVSNRLKTEIEAVRRKKISLVLPSPIDLTIWKPKAENIIKDDRCVYKVLFVSLNKKDPIKRYPVAEQAIEILNKRLKTVELSVASNIPFENMPAFVVDHDVVLCLSESEGWPNSVKEALACNIPFVATDVSDLNEIANYDNVCKICSLVPEDIADKLFSVLTNKSIYNVRKHVEHMDVKPSSEKLFEFYNKVLANR
jgi:glycosyltransferase involved in cell wall biosynthesis